MTKFDKVLILHSHTTGINYGGDDITTNHQPLTIALGVVDTTTYKMVDTVSVQIKWDGSKYTWDDRWIGTHGVTKEDRDNGETFTDAAAILGEFIYNHFGVKDSIPVMGYNPLSFHVQFLNKVLKSEDLHFKFDNRDIDLFPIMALMGKFTILEAYETFGIDTDSAISSMNHIKYFLKIFKTFKGIVSEAFDE
jgi:hypothetical protein